MSSKRLIVLTSLLVVCLCSTQKKSCMRPDVFRNVGEVADYVKCIKTITGSPPYGKRSVPNSSPFLEKLHPMLRQYDPEYLEELIYHILKAEREMMRRE
ncbi:unnamed protein product [Ceutorhynchus assimilis]|uniref:Uncharacterized protein n=1 Tax=Ceutorhynchus assimilis TaxID=467358 RepID=A0A9N9QBX2_9CUCU|nr:unnamed protein product [Ceutorhynchus assimilis]